MHLVVGVDIAQEAHVARSVSYWGIALGSPLEFGNHDEGFQLFGRWIQDLLKSYKLTKVIVGMEPPHLSGYVAQNGPVPLEKPTSTP
ncbi:hypothetical protein P9314_16290 [Paenibacillus validus]|uniref:IS110 family transposase n=1 Tax=Paenibacillus TaxID=44249 RepID=UPI000A5D4E6D|nr:MULTISPECIES: IS110 family transposase [Paenibacillus]MED4602246.1 hypothetical protein [Paenibacillus validus]MED4605091.1 hypothetical protein [Paenibacillus validus]